MFLKTAALLDVPLHLWILQSITAAVQPFRACIPLAASNSPSEKAVIFWSPAEQQVPGPGATFPVDGIKDSEFLCLTRLPISGWGGLFPRSPISQQRWSRHSLKEASSVKQLNLKKNPKQLRVAFLLLQC